MVVVLGPALIAYVVGARIWGGRLAAVLLSLVSGSLWGLFAVLTKGVVGELGNGIGDLLRTPELYAWALVALAGTMWAAVGLPGGCADRIIADDDGD